MTEWKQRVQKLRRFDGENPRGELIDISSILKVESTSNRCHNFHVDSPFKIDVIFTNFPRGISTSNRWLIDEDVSIGIAAGIICLSEKIFPTWWYLQRNGHKRQLFQSTYTKTSKWRYI